nr:HAD family phosphatase [Pseudoclavibacter sp. Marseille-Q3772]
MSALQAVLFDLDGTLIDSEPRWAQEEQALADRYGGRWSQYDAERTVGKSLRYTALQLQRGGVPRSVEIIMDELLDSVAESITRTAIPMQPGAAALLDAVAHEGLPAALVSSSYRMHIDAVCAQLNAQFAVTVAGDEVDRAKPDPQGYQRAMDQLGVDAAGCVAIEDSLSGVRAAIASGARVLAVPSVPEDAQAIADLGATVVASLEVVDVAMLRSLAEQ